MRARDESARSAAAFAALALLGLIAWLPVAGASGTLRLAPLAGLALVVAAAPRPRVAAVACAPLVWLVAGIPPALLVPTSWGELAAGLDSGFWDLFPASHDGGDLAVWPRAVATGLLAGCWTTAAVAMRRAARTGARTVSLVCLMLPVVLSVLAAGDDERAWLGAVALPLALLWYRPRHVGGAVGAACAGGAAVVALTVAGAGHSQAASLASEALDTGGAQVRRFDPSHTYDSLTGRRDGTTLLRVRSDEPAYWRAQVLERFDGRGWQPAQVPQADPAQPAARREEVEVEVAALESRGVVAPGDVLAVEGAGPASRGDDTVTLTAPPPRGSSYNVDALVTRASTAELAAAPLPTDSALRAYTTVELDGRPLTIPLRGAGPIAPETAAALLGSWYRRPLALAQELSSGTSSQLDVVRNVERFLEREYRYETDVDDGDQPIEDFLFGRRSGYCQHFSASAALLLRLAGIPARVATGFAPGVAEQPGVWRVRDLDAHSWIEVYFEGVGWVTVDPTPGTGPAAVPAAAETLRAQAAAPSSPSLLSAPTGAAVLAALAMAAVVGLRRRRNRDADATATRLLRALARRSGSHAPGVTYRELGSALELAVGPATAVLAQRLEQRHFAPAGENAAAVPVRAVWRAVVADRGLVRGTVLIGMGLPARR